MEQVAPKEMPRSGRHKSIFPQKLLSMINDCRLKEAIHWALHEKTFYVYENPLKNICLGKENSIFNTQDSKSFIRQMEQVTPKEMPRRGRHKSIFPQKLWSMINDSRLREAIHWASDGKTFYVYENPLKNICLGKENNIFYTQDPKSFIRQLHMYGFKKINKNQFHHECFRRDQPSLVKRIKRYYKAQAVSSDKPDKTSEGLTSDSSARESTEESTSSPSNNTWDKAQKESEIQKFKSPSSNDDVWNEAQMEAEFQKLEQHLQSLKEIGSNDQPLCSQAYPTNVGTLVSSINHYEDPCAPPPLSWYDGNFFEASFNYNDDTILTLYNDIYPDTCDDNNITF